MSLRQIYQIYEIMDELDINALKDIVWQNIKKIRLEYYNKYKKEYNNAMRFNNPYSVCNVASYLGISDTYYRRLESLNDYKNNISFEYLVKLSYLFDKKLDDFIKK